MPLYYKVTPLNRRPPKKQTKHHSEGGPTDGISLKPTLFGIGFHRFAWNDGVFRTAPVHKNIIFFILFLFLAACAHVVSPTGGVKDIQPPVAVRMIPENYSIHFKRKHIIITFNEFFQLKDINKQLVISPPLQERPAFRIKKKTLFVQLNEQQLKENTTYTFNFGTAITDITESNTIDNFQYVFSTGSYVDSLSVGGTLLSAFDKKPEAGILVMLYNDMDDSIPYKEPPAYFSKTNDAGNFIITNIKGGQYRIFALKDINNNYLFDLPNEAVAFADSSLSVSAKNPVVELPLFEEFHEKQFVKSASATEYGKLRFIFNLPTENIAIRTLNYSSKKPWKIPEFLPNKDTLYYWYTDLPTDTLVMQISDNNTILDTVSIPLPSKEQDKKLVLTIITNARQRMPFGLNKELKLELSHPVKDYNFSKIILKEDSAIVKYEIHFDDKALRKFYLKYPWKEGKTYELFIPRKCFYDIFDAANDSLRITFPVKRKRDYGSVLLKIDAHKGKHPYIVQLMDEQEKVLREHTIYKSKELLYEYLLPQKYKVKIIYDRNSNGKWDTGNYLQKIQPEKVTYYPGAIQIRANWDIDLEWAPPPQPTSSEREGK